MHIGFWWVSQKEGDQYTDLDVGGRIILRWILEKYDGVVWTGLIWLRIGIVEGSYGNGNEPSGSIKCWEIL
jgi:hypothetical protein